MLRLPVTQQFCGIYIAFGIVKRAPALALLIACMAFASGPRLDAAKYGDLSYGVYITHFPIIQMCIALGLFATPALGLVVSLGLTLIASYALWHLVEKRALHCLHRARRLQAAEDARRCGAGAAIGSRGRALGLAEATRRIRHRRCAEADRHLKSPTGRS